MSSLAVKYRPNSFSDVVGQLSTVQILKKQIQANKIKNCYIFSGRSGCGKTTLARIFANEINGTTGDYIEIDAAANSSVENVREIIKSAQEHSIYSQYKIFIIDEAHQFMAKGWDTFLKTIEEPPKFTIFIFCTTEPDKIPDTIKNRCQRFEFTKISSSLIEERLKYICNQEGFTNYDESCEFISKNCKNQMRDAITLLEQVADFDHNLSIDTTIMVSGSYYYDNFFKLFNNIIDGNLKGVTEEYNNITLSGINPTTLVDALLKFELDINKYIIFNDIAYTSLPVTFESNLKLLINFENPAKLHTYYLNNLMELRNNKIIDSDLILAYLFKLTRLG